MARVALPQSKLKARKRQRRLLMLAGAAVALLALVGLFAWGTHVPFLRIQNVVVEGAQALPPATVQRFVEEKIAGNYWYLFAKNNILLYPKRSISAGLLAQYPELRVADVHAQDFTTVAVQIVERKPKALWCPGSGSASCYFMDEDGVLYAPAPQFSAPVYLPYRGPIEGGALPKHYLNTEEFHSLSALIDALGQKVSSPIVDIAIDPNDDARVTFEDGFVLIFAAGDAGGDVFERFALALSAEPFEGHELSEFEYLDLRFGDKLYYKMR